MACLDVETTSLIHLETEESDFVGLVCRNRVTNTLAAVANKLCGVRVTLAVDGLSVSALGYIGSSLGGRETQDVGPLLERFLVC